jgi:pilus assembly protein CpaE
VAGPAKAPSQIRLLLVEDVGQVTRYIRGVLNAQTAVKLLDVVPDGTAVIDQIREQQPDVVVVDSLLTGRMNGLQVAESVRRAGIDLPIIVLTVPQKPVVVGGGMGLSRVLQMPFSGYDFMNMLQAVTAEHRAASPEAISRVIAFHGAKGGLGTTTVAYNAAVAIARTGRVRVLLFDGNLQYADQRSLLQVPQETKGIVDLPTDRLTQAEISEAIFTDENGLEILFGPPRIEDAEMITVRDMEKLLSILRRMYNIVIIDSPRAVNEISLAYFDAADLILQVATGEVAALYQTALMNATFQAIGFGPEKVRVLLNRYDAQGMLDDNAIRQYLGRPVDYHVANDFKLVVEANNRGHSVLATQHNSRVAHGINEVAKALTQALPAPPPRPVLA